MYLDFSQDFTDILLFIIFLFYKNFYRFTIIGLSVEMLATVGETIGEENPDIRGDMQEACRESRNVSSGLEKLCESLSHTVIGKND